MKEETSTKGKGAVNGTALPPREVFGSILKLNVFYCTEGSYGVASPLEAVEDT